MGLKRCRQWGATPVSARLQDIAPAVNPKGAEDTFQLIDLLPLAFSACGFQAILNLHIAGLIATTQAAYARRRDTVCDSRTWELSRFNSTKLIGVALLSTVAISFSGEPFLGYGLLWPILVTWVSVNRDVAEVVCIDLMGLLR